MMSATKDKLYIGAAFVLWLHIVLPVTGERNYQEYECQLESGRRGMCRAKSNCPSITFLSQRGVKPTVCFYEGDELYVCCDEETNTPELRSWKNPSSHIREFGRRRNQQAGHYGRDSYYSTDATGYDFVTEGEFFKPNSPYNSPFWIENTRPPYIQNNGQWQNGHNRRKNPPGLNKWTTNRPRTTTSRPNQNQLLWPTTDSYYNRPWITSPNENRKRISEIKCEEYSKPVTETVAVLPLTLDAKPVVFHTEKCVTAEKLIVGGRNATPGEFPHMAALGYPDSKKGTSWKCGGTLISEQFVMTAAHCIASSAGKPVKVRLGEHNLNRHDDGARPEDYFISEIVVHPQYKRTSKYYDIALLRLSKKVTFRDNVRPACLQVQHNIVERKAVATGWGRTQYFSETSETLLKVSISLIDNSKCSRAYPKDDKLPEGIKDNQMCAGESEGGKDTCNGDSGGPIQIRSTSNKCVHYVIGITSFGKFCAAPNTPGVYTRVSSFVPWIESVVWPQQ